jgi:hypothetical protein
MRRTLSGKFGFTKTDRPRHEWYELLDRNGNVIVATLLSRQASGRDISQPILSKISRQLCISKAQLTSAVECPLTREKYYEIIGMTG